MPLLASCQQSSLSGSLFPLVLYLGGAAGVCAGTAVGGSAGLVGGGAVGYYGYERSDEIKVAVGSVVDKVGTHGSALMKRVLASKDTPMKKSKKSLKIKGILKKTKKLAKIKGTVGFVLGPVETVEVVPCSEIYGQDPRTFVFGKDGQMLPAARPGFVSLESVLCDATSVSGKDAAYYKAVRTAPHEAVPPLKGHQAPCNLRGNSCLHAPVLRVIAGAAARICSAHSIMRFFGCNK